MASSHLRVVGEDSSEAKMQTISNTSDPALDPIFFHKKSVSVGTKLIHYGRKNPYSEWQVIKIVSWFTTNKRGIWKDRPVQIVRHLDDDVYLQCLDTKDTKRVDFGYISYSAIWRIKVEDAIQNKRD